LNTQEYLISGRLGHPFIVRRILKDMWFYIGIFVLLLTTTTGCNAIKFHPKPLTLQEEQITSGASLKKDVNVMFSPKGMLAVSEGGAGGNKIQLWSLQPQQLLRTLEAESSLLMHLAFSPDGKRLASNSLSDSGQTTIEIWDLESISPPKKLEETSSMVMPILFSPTGDKLIGSLRAGAIVSWDLKTGRIDRTVKTNSAVRDLVLSPDRHTLFSNGTTSLDAASSYQVMRLLDFKSLKTIKTLQEHKNSVSDVAFSPDGSKIAVTADSFVTLWDAKTGKLIHTLKGHLKNDSEALNSMEEKVNQGNQGKKIEINVLLSVSAVGFSPDGKLLASGGQDNTIKIWEVDTGKELYTLRGNDCTVNSVAFSPDGQVLVSGDRSVKIWKVSDFPLYSTPVAPSQSNICI
jgi:WD40 repeat protein